MPRHQFITSQPKSNIIELPQQGLDKEDFINDFKHYYIHLLGRDERCRSPFYAGEALSLAIRDRLMDRWKITHHQYKVADCRKTYYLSMEFLMGRTLSNAMLNLGINDVATDLLSRLYLSI
jgi:starch phosphorylase